MAEETEPRDEPAPVHDYVCSVCGASFTVTDAPEDAVAETDDPAAAAADAGAVECPACGSVLVREGWESRLRNAAGRKPPRPIEEMRDCVG